MRYHYFLGLFVCIAIGYGSIAQQQLNFHFRHINPADGLLHNEVSAITQDSKGFMWIGSNNGLQRYDGYRFTYYPEMLSDSRNRITDGVELYANKKANNLWIRKSGKIEKMEMGQNQFTSYNEVQVLKDSSYHFERYPGAGKKSWLLGDHGLFYYDSLSGKTTGILLNILPVSSRQSSYMARDKKGFTWVPLLNQLAVFDPFKKQVLTADNNPGNNALLALFKTGAALIRFIFIDSDDNTWVTTWGDAFYKYNPRDNRVTTYTLTAIREKQRNRAPVVATPLIDCMIEDSHGSTWIATENAGLLRYNAAMDNFDYCISEAQNTTGISYNYKIFTLFSDNSQNLWVGTDKGISIFNPYSQSFTALRYKENNPLSINKSEITSCLLHHDGSIMLSTWGGGIGVYDPALNFKENIYTVNKPWANYVWCMLDDKDGSTWMGCQQGTVVKKFAAGRTETLTPPELEGSTIRCMEADQYDNIWFGLNNGKIAQWNKSDQQFYGYGNTEAPGQGAAVLRIFFDNQDACWVSTESGFKKFDTHSRIYTHTWLPGDKAAGNISGTSTQGIEPLNDSILMIGTIYGGLNFFNKYSQRFTHLDMADGLPSNNIHAIKKDEHGFVWFTTDFGLYKFKPGENRFISYPIETGTLNASFTALSFYKSPGGSWFTFNSNEALGFDPAVLSARDSLRLPVTITGFKLPNDAKHFDALPMQDKPLKLLYDQNFFTIEFAALNNAHPGQVSYQYKLSGIDKDWVSIGNRPFAGFTNIPPGDYSFNVRTDNAGIAGPVSTLQLVIEPPFWKTKWFYLLVILMAALLIYFLVKARMSAIRKEEKNLRQFNQEMAEMEMKALRSQMNPHFIFNCINSIDSLIQSNDKYQATVYLNKFAKLIRNILDSSKQNTVTVSKDLDTLNLYIELEQLRHDKKFEAEIQVDESILQEDFKIPALVIQPFVENAILHGIRYRKDGLGKLSITITLLDGQLIYRIKDNGVGRNHNTSMHGAERTSYGIGMSKERVKLFNGEEKASVFIWDLTEHDLPCGTEVEVRLNLPI